VAESSGRSWGPTAEIVKKKGIISDLDKREVPFHNLDDMQWERVDTGGNYLPTVRIPEVLKEYDRLIFLPSLKTHGDAGFTVSIKLAMGFTPLDDRGLFHETSVAAAVADLARVIKPDLSVVDGRRAFISGGPTFGEEVSPGVLLASDDQVACDVEAVRLLILWGADDHLGVSDPWETEIIKCMADRAPQGIDVKNV